MKKVALLLLFVTSMIAGYSQTDTTKNQIDIRNLILRETKEGGKYDFFTPIKGHEFDGVQIKPGVYDTKLSLALILWGKANYESGVADLETAYPIYAEYKGRKISDRDKAYIKIGYNRELEKYLSN